MLSMFGDFFYPAPLTAEEKLVGALKFNNCPDCGTKDKFHEGPRGGMSINILCDECGSEFNLCWACIELSGRNSDKFNPERNWAFGLPDDWVPNNMRAECGNGASKSS